MKFSLWGIKFSLIIFSLMIFDFKELAADQLPVFSIPAQTVTVNPTDDVIILAFVNGDDISYPSGADSALVNALNLKVSCGPLLSAWILGTPELLDQGTSLAEANREYANAFLLKNSSNQIPGNFINPAEILANGDFRLYNELKVEFDSTDGKTIVPDSDNILNSFVSVGSTPDPCGILDPAPPDVSENNGKNGLTYSQSGFFQICEGQIDALGQDINQTVNQMSTPWIWSVLKFNADGTFVPNFFINNDSGSYSNTQIFPTYYIYVNNSLIKEIPQSPPDSFIALSSSSQLGLPIP